MTCIYVTLTTPSVLAHFLFIPSSFAHTKVVVIAGTTAVGKTDLSLELARRLEGEVVSVDSVQVRLPNSSPTKTVSGSCRCIVR